LFRKMKIHIPETIVADLRAYKHAGVNKVTSLMFGRYSWWAYEYGTYLFARASWNTGCEHTSIVHSYCEARYPSNADAMLAYYRDIEKASRLLLAFCEYDEVYDLRYIPVQDPAFYARHIEQIREAVGLYEKHVDALAALAEHGEALEKSSLKRELELLKITLEEARAVYYQMLGLYEYEHSEEKNQSLFFERLDMAIQHIANTKDAIADVPFEMKGNAGWKSLYVDHMCGDLINQVE